MYADSRRVAYEMNEAEKKEEGGESKGNGIHYMRFLMALLLRVSKRLHSTLVKLVLLSNKRIL